MNISDEDATGSSDRWQRLWEIFHEARGKATSERELYLKSVCGADTKLLREVQELLSAEEYTAGILRTYGAAMTAEMSDDAPNRMAEMFLSGQILSDRYQIVECLGSGGMGIVYKAIDLQLQRQVALKFLHVEDQRWSRRFQLEARVQARIEHENICKVYDVGELDGRHYIAMQFISGKTLKEAAAEMKLKEKARCFRQICRAVHAAHQLGVIHRDIKPTNVLVSRAETGEWTPYVTDFGLAREVSAPGMTSTGIVMGTAWYMAPEQARGEVRNLDVRCDIHALGATLYELLSGKPPFQGNSTMEVLTKLLNEDALPVRRHNPEIPGDLETIVQKCLQKEPDRRYQSAAALADDVARFLEGDPILAQPVTWRYRAVKRIKRYPVFSAAIAVAVLVVLGLSAFAFGTWWKAQAQSRLSNEFEQEIRYMEETARHAYTEPLHDVRQEEALVEQRLNAIEKRIKDEGSVAEGPGNFAMGRGNMALYRYQEARDHLEKAIQQYRLPRVTYALGVTLALLYQTELERAERIPVKAEREQKKREIEKELKDPALRYIAEGQTAIEAPEYIESLILFLEKKYDGALQKLQSAFHRQPWFYEARKLEADILRAMANDRRNTGDIDGAIRLYERAEAAYRAAVRKGSSYALGYSSLCALGHDWTTLMLYHTGFPNEEVLGKSIEACNVSLRINPDRPEAYLAKAALKSAQGSYLMSKGMDPTEIYNESIESARGALKWEAIRFAAYNNMAVAYSRRSVYEIRTGKDAAASLEQAVQCYRQAVQLNPNHAALRSNLGISLAIQAGYQKDRGRDVSNLQQEAIKQFLEAVRIQPDFVSAYSNLGEIHFEKARFEYEQKRNPIQIADVSVNYLRKAIEINPTFFLSYSNLGDVFVLKARHALDTESDPTGFLQEADQNLQKCLQLNPNYFQTYIKLAGANLIRAEYEMLQKGDPTPHLVKARTNLSKVEEAAPGTPELPAAIAEFSLASARWNLEQGSSRQAKADVRTGLENVDKVLAAKPADKQARQTKEKLLQLKARIS